MTALMRNGRDRRSGKPVTSAMRGLSARFWLGPDQRITSGPAATAAAFKGRIHGCTRPRSLKCPIFPLHRGRRPYMHFAQVAAARHVFRRCVLYKARSLAVTEFCSVASPINLRLWRWVWPYKPAIFSLRYSRTRVRALPGRVGQASIRLMIAAESP